jgi:hypothetical protein
MEETVSVFKIVVGHPYKPFCEGNGGLFLGLPYFPSSDSNSPVSSPQTYEPALL